jgi:hypothetical protein
MRKAVHRCAPFDPTAGDPAVANRWGIAMARPRKTKLYPLGLTPDLAADHILTRRSKVRKAVAMSELPAYVSEGNRVVILTEDLISWVRTWPKAERLAAYQKIKARIKQQKEATS